MNVTSERPVALMPVAKWQQKYRVDGTHLEKKPYFHSKKVRHGWSKRRSSANSVGNVDGNGKI